MEIPGTNQVILSFLFQLWLQMGEDLVDDGIDHSKEIGHVSLLSSAVSCRYNSQFSGKSS